MFAKPVDKIYASEHTNHILPIPIMLCATSEHAEMAFVGNRFIIYIYIYIYMYVYGHTKIFLHKKRK